LTVLDRAPCIAFIPVCDLVVAGRFDVEMSGLRVSDETRDAIVLTAGGAK